MNVKSFLAATALICLGVKSSLAQQYNGYMLFAPQNGTTATLYDTSFATYHTWSGLSSIGYSAHVEPGGELVTTAKSTSKPSGAPGGPICGRIQKHDYAGALTWDYTVSGTDFVSHHDICPMPNGNVLAICYERKTATEVSAAGASSSIQMWPDMILEIKPTGATTGTVVWEWHAWDHLMQNVDATKANYVSSLVNNPQLLNINYKQTSDWMHMNGVDYNPILDQIAFSSHNLNEWYIIDHSTTTAEAASHTGGNSGKGGDILYRWGNPAAYGATGTQILNVTHDAHWIPEGSPNAGRLAGYNNNGVSSSQSAADQIDVPINGYTYTITTGQAYGPSTYTHRNTISGMWSSNMGSTQQLPNGNELVCEATAGTIWEFNANGTKIMQHTFSGNLAQCHKYDECYLNNQAPAIPTISLVGNQLSASTAATYQWYKNGVLISGATSQTYTPTTAGIYLVRITDANGCFYQYSAGYKYNTANAITEVDLSSGIDVYPNPTRGIIHIADHDLMGSNYRISIIDAFGNVVLDVQNSQEIDLGMLVNGMYQVRLVAAHGTASKKILLNK